ncbi:MAG: NAD-dependent epimerase/dehydratase family protein [Siphonobacter sp.]
MILLTGANGLIGSAIARKFLAEGMAVRALKRPASDLSLVQDIAPLMEWVEGDILDVLSLEKAIAGCEYVVHAAAVVSFLPKEKELLYRVNVEGTANVVNVCLREKGIKLTYISSIAALGRVTPGSNQRGIVTIDENAKWEESPLNTHYARSKYQGELEVWRGISEGLSAVIVNPSIVLGEGDWDKSSTALFKYVFDEKPFYTSGILNYVDVKDVVEAIYQLTINDIKEERFIVNGGYTTYQHFFSLIAQYSGKKAPRYRVTPFLAEVAWRWEAIKAWFTGKSPLVTKETAKSSQQQFQYSAHKVQSTIGMKFRTLEETTQRITQVLLQKKTPGRTL